MKKLALEDNYRAEVQMEFDDLNEVYRALVVGALVNLAKSGVRLSADEMRMADCKTFDFQAIRGNIWQLIPLETRQEIAKARKNKEVVRQQLNKLN